MENPKRLIFIGAILVVFGFVAPLLMVLGILESTFWLNFLSYAASIGGLFVGTAGTALYARTKRK